ncbi:hypothetical protein HK104_010273, partial [Borealophlyctis nickersoniae]
MVTAYEASLKNSLITVRNRAETSSRVARSETDRLENMARRSSVARPEKYELGETRELLAAETFVFGFFEGAWRFAAAADFLEDVALGIGRMVGRRREG